jgi:hypothetical protein
VSKRYRATFTVKVSADSETDASYRYAFAMMDRFEPPYGQRGIDRVGRSKTFRVAGYAVVAFRGRATPMRTRANPEGTWDGLAQEAFDARLRAAFGAYENLAIEPPRG